MDGGVIDGGYIESGVTTGSSDCGCASCNTGAAMATSRTAQRTPAVDPVTRSAGARGRYLVR
jgi:hypothetical protein